ncbi:MAG: hypothetical protein AAFR99_22070, partial [Cyanobacteria bacterium J06629_9]
GGGRFARFLPQVARQSRASTVLTARSCVPSAKRLKLTVRPQAEIEGVREGAISTLQSAIDSGKINPDDRPIIELRIDGQVGFDRLELDTRDLQKQLQTLSNALIFLLRYDVDEADYASPQSDAASRLEIEQEIFTDLLAANTVYKKQAEALAHGLIDLKERQLSGETDAELYELMTQLTEQK